VTFLSGTFLSSAQKRGKGGDSDLEPIDSWLITQGMIPVAQPSVMDDIEVWLRTDLVRLDFSLSRVGCGEAERF